MKRIKFEILGLQDEIPDYYNFTDIGYVGDLLQTSERIYQELDVPAEMRDANYSHSVWDMGHCLKIHNYPKICDRSAYIYYIKLADETGNIWVRAHEEAHAACHLDLAEPLAKLIRREDMLNLFRGISEEDEEEFCRYASEYALRIRELSP